MLSKTCGYFRFLLLCGAPLVAAAEGGVQTLESGLGDQLEISYILDDQAAPHMVKACLIDHTLGAPKGFDIRPGTAPRFVTIDQLPVCADLFAGQHQIVFWRVSRGQFRPTLSLPLDLSGRAGERLLIMWRVDGAALSAANPAPNE